MRDLTRDNFGLLIAYVLPGFVALWGGSYHVEAVRPWLQSTPSDAPTVGGFLYATLASTTLGLITSGVRWTVVDRLLAWTGVRQPRWDFELVTERLAAWEMLVANHYRYYQFYSNMLVALAWTYLARLTALPTWSRREAWIGVGFVLVEGVLFLASRDTLEKYYERTGALLRARTPRDRHTCGKERTPGEDPSATRGTRTSPPTGLP